MGSDAPHAIPVVEDDPDRRRILQLQLQSLGPTVRTAADGRQGLESARRGPPGLILLDRMMPGRDRFQVLKRGKILDHHLAAGRA